MEYEKCNTYFIVYTELKFAIHIRWAISSYLGYLCQLVFHGNISKSAENSMVNSVHNNNMLLCGKCY